MKTTFGSASGSRVKNTVLSVLAILLFLAALACVIIALVKSPEAPTAKDPQGSQSTDDNNQGSNYIPPKTGIKTISEYTEQIVITEAGPTAPAIESMADTLLRHLIVAASNSDSTAYEITKILSINTALFNHTQDTSSVCAAPLSSNVWFVSSSAKLEHTGNLTVDSNGEVFLGGRYIVKTGNTFTLYDQAEYEAMPPVEIPSFVWGEYDASTTIGAAEMTLSNGVKLAMTYDAVESKMGGFDSVDTSSPRTKTAVKAGYTFTFSLVDASSNSANDWGLPHDGNYYLTYIAADSTCADEFPRGIKIGDSIENVFTKFPCANSKLQQWKEQRLYGAYEYKANTVYCFLEYRTYLASYRILAQDAGREQIGIIFGNNKGDYHNKVEGFEWIYQQ